MPHRKDPNEPDGQRSAREYLEIGARMQALGRLDDASVQYEAAIARFPKSSLAYNNLGTILQTKGRLEDALASFHKAYSLDKRDGRIAVNIGVTLQLLNRPNDAVVWLTRAVHSIAQNRDHHKVHRVAAEMALATALLATGDYVEGWRHYEWRHQLPALARLYVGIQKPVWKGNDIQKCHLLVIAEQGIGDTVQFMRYLPLLVERVAKLTITVPLALLGLAREIEGISAVSAAPSEIDYDTFIPLLSLPRILGTTIDNVPSEVPYLRVPLAERGRANALLPVKSKLWIGVVWAGNVNNVNDNVRSVRWNHIVPLFGLDNVCFFSLQLTSPEESVRARDCNVAILPLEANNIALTTAFAERMDLVITVDTAMAHIAGGLGIETWLLLPLVSDWRWLVDRTDSIWYPTMRIFRQTVSGDWNSVLRDVAKAIADLP